MELEVTIVPVRCDGEYNGNGANGPYTVGTWAVKSPVDNKEFIVKCFTVDHEKMKNNVGVVIICKMIISSRAYQGKIYNDINISGVAPSGNVPVEISAKDIKTEIPSAGVDIGSMTLPGGNNDLPF